MCFACGSEPRILKAIATNTSVLRKTKPKPKPNPPRHAQTPARAIAVSSWPATHTTSVPCIPRARTPTLALTSEKTPTPHRRNCGNPRVQATTTNGELILQPQQRWTPEQKLEMLNTHPLFTGRCPQCEMTYPQYETPPVHWHCSECGWMDDSV